MSVAAVSRPSGTYLVRTTAEIDALEAKIRAAADRLPAILRAHEGTGLELLRRIKFEAVGWHPVEDRNLNLIEQVNQTFASLVCLKAARLLLDWHPEVGGLRLVLGAHRGLDIESETPELVAAEAFAAVEPGSNDKLKQDCRKMAGVSAKHRYVFFHCPKIREGPYTGHAGAIGTGVVLYAVDV